MSAEPATTATLRGSPIASLFPGSFALVMATGIVSIAADQQGFGGPSRCSGQRGGLRRAVGRVAAPARAVPRLILDDLASHQRGAGFLTVVAGTNVLGSQVALTSPGGARRDCGGRPGPWVVLPYAFLTAVTFREPKPELGMGMGGGGCSWSSPPNRSRCSARWWRPRSGRTEPVRRPPGAPGRADALHRRDRADLLPMDLLLDGRRAGDAAVLDQHGGAGDHGARRLEPDPGGRVLGAARGADAVPHRDDDCSGGSRRGGSVAARDRRLAARRRARTPSATTRSTGRSSSP